MVGTSAILAPAPRQSVTRERSALTVRSTGGVGTAAISSKSRGTLAKAGTAAQSARGAIGR